MKLSKSKVFLCYDSYAGINSSYFYNFRILNVITCELQRIAIEYKHNEIKK